MIYFDNSATTRRKPTAVIIATLKGLTSFSANPGRSGHELSISAAVEVEKTRELVKNLVDADSEYDVVFTQNCTDALNLAILGSFVEGGHVITTDNEHNSVLRPLNHLRDNGKITFSVCSTNKDGLIGRNDIEKLCTPKTFMVITNHISNVNGDEAQIEEIGKLCKERGYIFIVDGAQSVGHKHISMKKANISMLAIAGHKGPMSPQGIGVLVISKKMHLSPIRFGGTGTNSLSLIQPTEMPEGFESGTVATPNILGLQAGIEYVSKHLPEIEQKITALSEYCLKKLTFLKDFIVYTTKKNGVIAFNHKTLDSTNVADILNENKIYVRPGLHCAPLKHTSLETTKKGAVRVSFSVYNTFDEIDHMIDVLSRIKQYLYL